jgi:hypothetical protein
MMEKAKYAMTREQHQLWIHTQGKMMTNKSEAVTHSRRAQPYVAPSIGGQRPGWMPVQAELMREMGYTMLFCLLIALISAISYPEPSFFQHFAYANCIGISIFLWVRGFAWCWPRYAKTYRLQMAAVIPGMLCGYVLANSLGLENPPSHQHEPWPQLVLIFAIGMIAVVIFMQIYRNQQFRLEIAQQRAQLLASTQQQTLAQLQLLQAQMEPHFLFNTLATVQGLIDQQPRQANYVLERLNQCLRISLHRSRQSMTTLAHEVELLEALLDIANIRLGDRLRFSFAIPAEHLHWPLPPLMLQPLLENALQHAIEPHPMGGHILISSSIRPLHCSAPPAALDAPSAPSSESSAILHTTDDEKSQGCQMAWYLAVQDRCSLPDDLPSMRPLRRNAHDDNACAAIGRFNTTGHGLALANLRQRLLHCYGDLAQFQLYHLDTSATSNDASGGHQGTLAQIRLPLPTEPLA